MRIPLFSIFFAVAGASLGCLDMPIATLAKAGKPDALGDALGDADEGPQEACRRCLAAPEDPGPGCQAPYLECIGDTKCNLVITCGFENSCFQGSRRGFLQCGLPCLSKYAPTPDEPVVVLASKLFGCLGTGSCGDTCFSSE